MKYIKKIMGVIAVFSYIIIGFTVLLTLPMVLGKKPMIVLSGSMKPTFPVGSLVYMESATFDEIQNGDVVTYGAEGLVSHRVIEKKESSLITKGDANIDSDPEIKAEQIVGKVCDGISIPYAGYFLSLMRSPTVLTAIAIIIISQMLFEQTGKKKREVKEYETI